MSRAHPDRFSRFAGGAAVALVLASTAAASPPARLEAQTPERYAELYASGQTYEAFFEDARARRALWEANTERATAPAGLVERLRAAGGRWKLLAVAVDGCSDSVSTIPYIAALAAAVPNVELRIIDPDEGGRAIMEAHRTPDGRAATPTVILLDASFAEAGAWIERPAELQRWYSDRERAAGRSAAQDGKMAWYERDAGAATLEEIVALIEAAASR